jgi:hypothetical protein
MKKLSIKYIKIPMLVIFTLFTLMLYNGPANAGDYTMQTNLNDMAEMMSKWSKQLSSGKMEPKAQEKLGEIMSRMSQVLRDLSAKTGDDMHMDHHNKIQGMKKEWDPFDTSDRM